MTGPEVLEKTPMNISEVRAALERIHKGDEELNFRAQKTLEYAQELGKLAPKKAEELAKKLTELDVPRLKDAHIHKLIDLMPVSEKQTKLIVTSYHLTVSGENVKKITDTIADYVKK